LSLRLAACLAVLGFLAIGAGAQRPEAVPGPAAPTVTAGPGGFALESASGDFRLRLRGYVQFDGRLFLDDDAEAAADTFLVRRARPVLEGTLYRIFDVRLMPDFAGGSTSLQDAFLEARFAPGARLRAGKFKSPVGLERLQSAVDLVFVERALPTALVPNRDLGVQLGGQLAGRRLEYALGIFDGAVDGGSSESDASDDKDIAGRLLWLPFQTAAGAPRIDLAVGFAASRGEERGAIAAPGLPTLKTPGQQTFFAYRTDGSVAGTTIADGERRRLAPQGWLYVGPFGALAEWVRSEQRVRRDVGVAELAHEAWQLQLSWVVSGERNGYRGVVPRRPFEAAPAGGRGAWIVAVRASGLDADRQAFPAFADPARAARAATSLGASLSWNLVRGVRWMLAYDRTEFEGGGAGGGDRPAEQALFTRFQVSF
jgi:phosphate-selective porin OprO/OprP